jgi:beta-lactamase class A
VSSPLQVAVDHACRATPDVRWSICLRDLTTGEVLAAHEPERILSTASIGKLLLLVALTTAYQRGDVAPDELLERASELEVADSGLWQHLRVARLPVDDLAVLVGSVSDNTATNVLLQRVGLPRVQEAAVSLGLEHTALLDRVRSHRTVTEPPHLSVGSAGELSRLCSDLAGGRLGPDLDRWLAAGTDTSMVAGAFHLDPLAHVDPDRGVLLRHKTGTDDGVRGDVGWVRGPSAAVGYAVLANWRHDDHRDAVLYAMGRVGAELAEHVG